MEESTGQISSDQCFWNGQQMNHSMKSAVGLYVKKSVASRSNFPTTIASCIVYVNDNDYH